MHNLALVKKKQAKDTQKHMPKAKPVDPTSPVRTLISVCTSYTIQHITVLIRRRPGLTHNEHSQQNI